MYASIHIYYAYTAYLTWEPLYQGHHWDCFWSARDVGPGDRNPQEYPQESGQIKQSESTNFSPGTKLLASLVFLHPNVLYTYQETSYYTERVKGQQCALWNGVHAHASGMAAVLHPDEITCSAVMDLCTNELL